VYKTRNNRNPARALELELRKVNIDLEDDQRLSTGEKRITIETWGNETSLNEYRYCKHVVLVGILHRDLTELEAQALGQLNDLHRKLTTEDVHDICLSERCHHAYQALSRGSCRVMDEPSQAGAMTGYIVEFDERIEEELSKVMPGVTWKTWEPVYLDLVAHGKLVLTLSQRVASHLTNLPPTTSKVATRRLKADIQAERVDKNTWLRAIHKAVGENPQWKLEDRSLLRLAS
jgi:hypothetical protein